MANEITNYQCPACTGPLHFGSESGVLECDYCGSRFSVEDIDRMYAEKNANAQEATEQREAKDRPQADRPVIQGDGDIIADIARNEIQHPLAHDRERDGNDNDEDQAQCVEQELDLVAQKIRRCFFTVGPADRAHERSCRPVRKVNGKNEREPQ